MVGPGMSQLALRAVTKMQSLGLPRGPPSAADTLLLGQALPARLGAHGNLSLPGRRYPQLLQWGYEGVVGQP